MIVNQPSKLPVWLFVAHAVPRHSVGSMYTPISGESYRPQNSTVVDCGRRVVFTLSAAVRDSFVTPLTNRLCIDISYQGLSELGGLTAESYIVTTYIKTLYSK